MTGNACSRICISTVLIISTLIGISRGWLTVKLWFLFCSTLIKGVVCTKNIKHKRMTSQYKKPRLLLLGGALEYQKVPNQLASFDTLLQQVPSRLINGLCIFQFKFSFSWKKILI